MYCTAFVNPWQSGPKCTPEDLYRTSDPQRQEMGKSTELTPLFSTLFWAFLNDLQFLMEIVNAHLYNWY